MKAEGIKRSERVAGRVKTELMDLLLRGAVRDPAAAGTFVSRVTLTDDLRTARIYVRMLDDEVASEQRQKQIVRAFKRASGHIRRELAPRLQLKYQPDLTFFWDEGGDARRRIEDVLDEIRRDGGLE